MDVKIVETVTEQCLSQIQGDTTLAIDMLLKYSDGNSYILPEELHARLRMLLEVRAIVEGVLQP